VGEWRRSLIGKNDCHTGEGMGLGAARFPEHPHLQNGPKDGGGKGDVQVGGGWGSQDNSCTGSLSGVDVGVIEPTP
jgi:hypothetical protein